MVPGIIRFSAYIICSCILLLGLSQITVGDEDGEKQLSNLKRLKDDLFKNYDSHVRPVVHHSNSTNVEISLDPLYLIDLVEDTSLFILDAWILMHWSDNRLAWKPEDYEGLDLIQIPDHYIWQPDIMVYNSHSWNVDPKGNTHLLLYSDGGVWFVPPAMFTTYCPLIPVAGSYPREIVECDIVLGSWSHDGWQINLTIIEEEDGVYLGSFMNTHPRWEVLLHQVNISRVIKYYNCCQEPYVTVNVKFPLQRRYPPELNVIWTPCILVMTLTLTMFWIPSDSGKKLILGCFLFISLISLIAFVGLETKSQKSMMLAVGFLESTLYAVVSALVLEIIVINLSSLVGSSRPPDILVRLLSGPLGRTIAVFPRWEERIPGDRIQLKEDSENVVNHPTPKDEWILIATALDRILFVLYIIVFAAIHRD